jgi:16S rRNA processing protein RimM
MHVHTTDGEYLGKVNQILETGANDVYLVQNEEGVDLLLPAIESVIMEVDLDKQRMVVDLLPGLRSDSPD